MMTNLFSAFDPATSTWSSMNWSSMMITFILVPSYYWSLPNRSQSIINNIMIKLNQEFKTLISINPEKITMLFVSLFMLILTNNMMGLLPYMFTSTSHIIITISMALPLWVGFMMYGWINHTKHMFAHLLPAGTPLPLMPFMVCIETVSNMIRPGSLAVRLMANMIAGHLLMSLLGNNAVSTANFIIPLIAILQMGLMSFEIAVSVIQAYVFSVLSTLYSSEVN
uniref:ATP synthase subunit a n=1 Tax=Aneurus sublobatus TaxID=1176473 RepID=A0A171LH88_9HEMI|nr:ATP synthase F0 subunit 6 [Aneurus sublobatus]AFI54693.1 ATP synthase F0 subunit 6 [Aneurus sublobatus]